MNAIMQRGSPCEGSKCKIHAQTVRWQGVLLLDDTHRCLDRCLSSQAGCSEYKLTSLDHRLLATTQGCVSFSQRGFSDYITSLPLNGSTVVATSVPADAS